MNSTMVLSQSLESLLGTSSPDCPSKSNGRMVRCYRLRCPLARLSGLQYLNMGHNGHGIMVLYGVVMSHLGNLHAGRQSSLGNDEMMVF